jgi:integrase
MNYTFKSFLKDKILNFITYKKSLGFSYKANLKCLQNFDLLCFDHFNSETMLSQNICLKWAEKHPNELNKTLNSRVGLIREFARFLIRIGEKAYLLPDNFAKNESKYLPYIYSKEEIRSIFTACESLNQSKLNKITVIVFTAIIKLLYYCGLRPFEARNLLTQDIDLNNGKIRIINSKGFKSRTVIMDDEVTNMIKNYDSQIKQLLPNRTIFFPNYKGGLISRKHLPTIFLKVRVKAGIPIHGPNHPRLYDLRHTFATHNLYKWMAEGKDIMSYLPYLSIYMGHANISDTYYYIHFVPELITKIANFKFNSTEYIIPEVESDE